LHFATPNAKFHQIVAAKPPRNPVLRASRAAAAAARRFNGADPTPVAHALLKSFWAPGSEKSPGGYGLRDPAI